MRLVKSWPYFVLLAVTLTVTFGVGYQFYRTSNRSVKKALARAPVKVEQPISEPQESQIVSIVESPAQTNAKEEPEYQIDVETTALFTGVDPTIMQALDELYASHMQNPNPVEKPVETNEAASKAVSEEHQFVSQAEPEQQHTSQMHAQAQDTQTQFSQSTSQDYQEPRTDDAPAVQTEPVLDLPCNPLCETPCNSPCEAVCCNNLPQECCGAWWAPIRFYEEHTEGRWLSNTIGYTTLGIFGISPLYRGSNLLFLADFRGIVLNNGRKASNAGLGLRYFNPDSHTVYGVNTYYDYLRGHLGHYDQIGAGFEVLNPCWEFRLNTYFPVGKNRQHSRLHVFNNFSDKKFFATCQEHQTSMGGGDLELGRWFRFCGCNFFDLFLGVGGHYYQNKHEKRRYGGEARISSHLGQYFTIDVLGGYDRLTKGMVQGRITFSFPLYNPSSSDCGGCSCPIECFAFQPIHRQELITLGHEDCCWHWNWDDHHRSDSSSSSSSSH